MSERMLNKEIEPSKEELIAYCGKQGSAFLELHTFLSETFHTTQEIRFPYGLQYGWCITHRKGKKLICDVFAEKDAFTVMLRLSDKQFFEQYDDLLEETRMLIDHRYPCGNGGWIHYQVLNEEYNRDIKALLSIKCR